LALPRRSAAAMSHSAFISRSCSRRSTKSVPLRAGAA
jgi:hypothetical protein